MSLGFLAIIGWGCMTLTSTISSAGEVPADDGPPGASVAFTSDDPVVKRAIALMGEGKLKEADELLARNDDADKSIAPAREETKEIIRRLRREYSRDAD